VLRIVFLGGERMARRKRLTDDELKLIDTKISDEEAFKQFKRNCLIRNLRPATIKYYKSELLAVKASLKELEIKKDIVQLTQKVNCTLCKGHFEKA